MQRPPNGVKLVMEAVCIMQGIKPKKVPGEKPGTKVDDYWEPAKGLLQDPGKFLESLFKYDKVKQISNGYIVMFVLNIIIASFKSSAFLISCLCNLVILVFFCRTTSQIM